MHGGDGLPLQAKTNSVKLYVHHAYARRVGLVSLFPSAGKHLNLDLSIEIATRAADNFTRIYYTTYDSDTRLSDLPQFYRPTSSLTWNGKPFQGSDGLRQLIEKMPPTKHEMQSFDCHPIPGLQKVL